MPQRAVVKSVFAALAGFFVFAAPAEPSRGEAPAAPVEAIRKTQEIAFHFQSFTTFYSCTSLRTKVERVMRALGTDARVRVRSPDCPGSVARLPRIIIDVTSLVEATPEAIAAREKDRSKRELVARVRGERGEDIEGGERFAALWQPVRLSRSELDFGPGDCELLEQIKRAVLPKLAVRIVRDDVRCSPNQVSFNQPYLEVEALVGTPEPDEADQAPEQGTNTGPSR